MGVRDKYVNAGTVTDLCRCGMHRTWRFLHIESALLDSNINFKQLGLL
jgi:hypothetical protein